MTEKVLNNNALSEDMMDNVDKAPPEVSDETKPNASPLNIHQSQVALSPAGMNQEVVNLEKPRAMLDGMDLVDVRSVTINIQGAPPLKEFHEIQVADNNSQVQPRAKPADCTEEKSGKTRKASKSVPKNPIGEDPMKEARWILNKVIAKVCKMTLKVDPALEKNEVEIISKTDENYELQNVWHEVVFDVQSHFTVFRDLLEIPDFTFLELEKELMCERENPSKPSLLIGYIWKKLLGLDTKRDDSDETETQKKNDAISQKLSEVFKQQSPHNPFSNMTDFDVVQLPIIVKLLLMMELMNNHLGVKEGQEAIDTYKHDFFCKFDCHNGSSLYYFNDYRLFEKVPQSDPIMMADEYKNEPWSDFYKVEMKRGWYKLVAHDGTSWRDSIKKLAPEDAEIKKKLHQIFTVRVSLNLTQYENQTHENMTRRQKMGQVIERKMRLRVKRKLDDGIAKTDAKKQRSIENPTTSSSMFKFVIEDFETKASQLTLSEQRRLAINQIHLTVASLTKKWLDFVGVRKAPPHIKTFIDFVSRKYPSEISQEVWNDYQSNILTFIKQCADLDSVLIDEKSNKQRIYSSFVILLVWYYFSNIDDGSIVEKSHLECLLDLRVRINEKLEDNWDLILFHMYCQEDAEKIPVNEDFAQLPADRKQREILKLFDTWYASICGFWKEFYQMEEFPDDINSLGYSIAKFKRFAPSLWWKNIPDENWNSFLKLVHERIMIVVEPTTIDNPEREFLTEDRHLCLALLKLQKGIFNACYDKKKMPKIVKKWLIEANIGICKVKFLLERSPRKVKPFPFDIEA